MRPSEPLTLVVGRIARAHGIRGELAVEVRTDEPERRLAPGSVVLSEGREVTIAAARTHQGKLLVRLDGVDDRTAAEAWQGRLLEVRVDPDEVPAEDDAYYDHQLVDLQVRTTAGDPVGVVRAVQHLAAQDLLVLDVDGREVLVPFVEALVPEVDLAAGHLVVADVPGLLDPDAAETAD